MRALFVFFVLFFVLPPLILSAFEDLPHAEPQTNRSESKAPDFQAPTSDASGTSTSPQKDEVTTQPNTLTAKKTRGRSQEVTGICLGDRFDGKVWKKDGVHKGTRYFKCSRQGCSARKKVAGEKVTYLGNHSPSCPVLHPIASTREIATRIEMGQSQYDAKRDILSHASLPHHVPDLPIFDEKGIESGYARYIRERQPFNSDMLNTCLRYRNFVRSIRIHPDFEMILASDESLEELQGNRCPVTFFDGTHSMIKMQVGEKKMQLLTLATLSECNEILPVAHGVTSSKEKETYARFLREVWELTGRNWGLFFFFFFFC